MGDASLQAVEAPLKLEWSEEALGDLSRFAEFLHERHPRLAGMVAAELIARASVISDNPGLGRRMSGHPSYRQIALRVLNATYVFQYRYDGRHLMMLRVFHGREFPGAPPARAFPEA